MARKVRIQYPGAMYHVMNRGDRREAIFADDEDRERFLETLAETCEKTQWQVHAYCLMRNHFHLVLETPQPNLVAGMAWLQSTYTIRFNHRHQLFGVRDAFTQASQPRGACSWQSMHKLCDHPPQFTWRHER